MAKGNHKKTHTGDTVITKANGLISRPKGSPHLNSQISRPIFTAGSMKV